MEPGKHKKRIHYTVMIVSDSAEGGIHRFRMSRWLIVAAVFLIAVILAVLAGVAIHRSTLLQAAQSEGTDLQKQIDELTQTNQTLSTENEELSDKVAILSDTVAQNAQALEAQAREEEEERIPNGFPFAGPAVILESSETGAAAATEDGADEDADAEETDAELDADAAEAGTEADTDAAEDEPIVIFSASEGTKVIAAAGGVVASVEEDAVYGYRVTIDHENGYTSIYRAAAEPVVEQGDEVTTGAMLYQMQSDDARLGYQITQDGALIDPLDLLEVYG